MKKRIVLFLSIICILIGALQPGVTAFAKGTTYSQMNDVYYTKEGCVVYAEPTYTSTVLTTIGANIPVRVIGAYTNGWYRINIGVIAYCKMDSLTTAGNIGIVSEADKQAFYAKQTADELGYQFEYMKLNNEKKIKKDIFNSYIGKKVILFAVIDEVTAVSFKMLYADEVKNDISLKYTSKASDSVGGGRTIEYTLADKTELWGQVAIFQFKVGYDKSADMYIGDIDGSEYTKMNTYYTEFSEFAYAPVTQVGNMKVVECEIPNSLSAEVREKMGNIRKGIKYLSYDEKDYRSMITSKLRKDTEYMDYEY
ncbi:MAG: SH3 domain-containing protein [Lachnospiraceae bacterium]|nr:SH3 domain-containing protein [Lachnospiraceae bacterium]